MKLFSRLFKGIFSHVDNQFSIIFKSSVKLFLRRWLWMYQNTTQRVLQVLTQTHHNFGVKNTSVKDAERGFLVSSFFQYILVLPLHE